MYREMTIHAFGLDSGTKLPVIILNDLVDEHKVPLWLNAGDLVVIATDMVGRELIKEKETTDLVSSLLRNLGLSPERVFLDDQEDGSYRARLRLERQDGDVIIPLAVHEAVLMAMRYTLPVLVASSLVERLSLPRGTSDRNHGQDDDFDGLLERLDPAEMGKFPM